MTEVGKSLRMEAALSDAITRRAEANGQSFTAYVIEVLERSLQEPQATSSSNPASDSEALLAPLRVEMTSLRDVLRAERLGHSEVVDAILGLSRVAKEFESERQRMVEVVAKASVELDKAKEDLKRKRSTGAGFWPSTAGVGSPCPARRANRWRREEQRTRAVLS